MEKLVAKLRKKFLSEDDINLIDLSISESIDCETSSILSILEPNADKKYIIKTNPVVKRIYTKSVESKLDKVAIKVRKDNCTSCNKITLQEVMKENDLLWDCQCLVCKATNSINISPLEDINNE